MSSGYQAVNKCLSDFLGLPPGTLSAKLEILAYDYPRLTITSMVQTERGEPSGLVHKNFQLVPDASGAMNGR